jgi:hypothetical protein
VLRRTCTVLRIRDAHRRRVEAIRIRRFVSQVLASQPEGAPHELRKRVAWALKEAGALDRVTSGPFEVPQTFRLDQQT